MADLKMWQDKAARRSFQERGQALFQQIKPQIQERSGILAIELDSGEYFIGQTLGEANEAARRRYRDQWLYFIRLDHPEAAIPLPVW